MARITQIQVRRDTAANWTSQNPTLAEGEVGFEKDTGKFKVGPTGGALWNSITKYAVDASYVTGTSLSTSVTTATGITSVGTLGSLSVTGTTTSGTFSGNGASLTNLNTGNLSGQVAIANGGTGATTAALALSALGGAAKGTNNDITSLTALSTPLTAAQGGTGVNNSTNTITVSGGAATLQSQTSVSATYVPVLYYSNAADIAHPSVGTAKQKMFNKAVALAADTAYEYEFYWFITITNNANTAGFSLSANYDSTLSTNGTSQTGLYIHAQYYSASQGTATAVNNAASTFYTYEIAATSGNNLVTISSFGPGGFAGNATVSFRVAGKGIIRTQSAGNFYPGAVIGSLGASAFTTGANSFLRLTPLGPAGSSGAANPIAIGTWA